MIQFNFPPTVLDKTGLATSANQSAEITELQTVNSHLSSIESSAADISTHATAIDTNTANATSTLISINSKTPALGQQLAAGSSPVVLTAAQLSTLTPLANVGINNFPAIQSVSGTVTANAGTGTFQTVITNSSLPVTGTFFQTTQPVSAASLPLPAGAATSANQATMQTSLSSIDTKTPALGQALAASSVPVVLTAAQLTTLTPLSSVSVSNFPATQAVTGTFFQTTQPVSIAATVAVSGTVTANAGTNLNTSLLALDSTVAKDASLTTLNTSVNTLLKPASTLAAVTAITNTVTIKADTAVNQANALKVDGSATTQPISAAALPLPTGASTSANQTTTNTSLASIDTKLSSQATATNQTTANTSLSSIDTKLSALNGRSRANAPFRQDYTTTSITTAAYTTVAAALTSAVKELEIFDSSGEDLVLAIGAAASEVDQLYIFPGGNGRIPLAISAGVRVSVKAVSATAAVGKILINFYG